MDRNQKTPATENQIRAERPNVPKTNTILSGHVGGSMQGGHDKVIGWFEVMQGQQIEKLVANLDIKLLTPKTPSYQNLYMTIDTYFAPHSSVWDNAEKFYSQAGGTTETKIKKMPSFGGKIIPAFEAYDTEEAQGVYVNLQNTEIWKKLPISDYIPRRKTYSYNNTTAEASQYTMPEYNALLMRERMAIYNDFRRNKELDPIATIYKTDTVSNTEWDEYIGGNQSFFDENRKRQTEILRSKRPNSYYTDIRTELQGFETEMPTEATNELLTHAEWLAKIDSARTQAEMAQMNAWEVIAKLTGSKEATQGKIQHIGRKTIRLNYSSITQTAYDSTNINQEAQVLGFQGAYSFTQGDFELAAFFQAEEYGAIHIIATVWAESVFERGFDRTMLNVNAEDKYTPDKAEQKVDVLLKSEIETNDNNTAIGFKRKFNEYFKLPNVLTGDILSTPYAIVNGATGEYAIPTLYNQPIDTYQFYETTAESYYTYTQNGYRRWQKKYWKDYTDLLINKNQAVLYQPRGYEEPDGTTDSNPIIELAGPDQIQYIGKLYAITTMPIDEAIKNNYNAWGEI